MDDDSKLARNRGQTSPDYDGGNAVAQVQREDDAGLDDILLPSSQEVKAAFNRMTPDEEAYTRMLSHILAAAEAQREQAAADPGEGGHRKIRTDVSRETSEGGRLESTAYSRSQGKKRFAPAIGLSIAACLILLVGIGFSVPTLISPNSQSREATAFLQESADDGLADAPTGDEAESVPGNAPEDARGDGSAAASDASEEQLDASPSGDSSASGPSADGESLPRKYPIIESGHLGRLSTLDETESDIIGIANPSLLGAEIGSAKAVGTDGSSAVDCTIYRYSAAGAVRYAVLYDGDTVYYLASPST